MITGRNGAVILADWPGALHVLLDGPVQQRIERAAAESGAYTGIRGGAPRGWYLRST